SAAGTGRRPRDPSRGWGGRHDEATGDAGTRLGEHAGAGGEGGAGGEDVVDEEDDVLRAGRAEQAHARGPVAATCTQVEPVLVPPSAGAAQEVDGADGPSLPRDPGLRDPRGDGVGQVGGDQLPAEPAPQP